MPRDLPSARFYALAFLLGAAMQLAGSAGGFLHVWHGGLVDPDSYMRLVRIEQGLKLGHLVNMVQRDDSGAPLLIEWSRLFDAALVALAAPLAPFLGWHTALRWAGIASAPLAAGALGVGLAFAVAPFAERRFLWLAPFLAPLFAGIHGFERIGVIHYHIIMVAGTAIALGWAVRTGTGGRNAATTSGIAAGVAAGIAIWIMPETMPFVLLGFVGLGWAWMFRPLGGVIRLAGLTFLATLAVALWLDPPHGGTFVAELDRVSIIYAALALAVVATGVWLAWLDGRDLPRGQRAGLGMLGALACFALWLTAYPDVVRGPYALIPPAQFRLFFGAMLETQPVHGLGPAAASLGPGLFGLAVALARAWRARRQPEAAGAWGIAAAGGLIALGLTARFVIFQAFPTAFGAALLPVALSDASAHFAARPSRAAAARIGLIALVLAAPYAIALAALLAQGKAHPAASEPACALRGVASLLTPAAGQVVLSRIGEVPELLYRSRIIAVGSLYQHGVEGYLRARAAWRAPSAGPRPSAALRATGARFVLFCPRVADSIFQGARPDALWFLLTSGHPPPWLRLVGTQAGTGFQLYRVLPTAAE